MEQGTANDDDDDDGGSDHQIIDVDKHLKNFTVAVLVTLKYKINSTYP